MTDKEKIRAEIERRISIINNRENKIPADKVAVIQLEAVLSFIDSLQEESVSELLEEELDSYIKDNFTIDKEQLDRFGLDEKDYMYSMDKSDMLAMVCHFTELQHKKDVVITEDLIANAFANGMADMKQQMIKYAVVGGCFVDNLWHDASEEPKRENLLIETNDGRIIHRQSINNYGMVKRWAYTSDLLNLDNSCNFGKNLQEEPKKCMFTLDHYTEEDRKVLCADCDEKDCELRSKPIKLREQKGVLGKMLDKLDDKEIEKVRQEMIKESGDELAMEIESLSKRYPEVSYAKLSRIAVHISKWQRKQIIDKACEWLDGAIPDYIELKRANVDTFINIDNKKFVEDFCKAMED